MKLEVQSSANPEVAVVVMSITQGTLLAYTPSVVKTDEPIFPTGPDKADAYTVQMAVIGAAIGRPIILVDTQGTVVEVGSQLKLLILLLQGQEPTELGAGDKAAVAGSLTLGISADAVEAAQADMLGAVQIVIAPLATEGKQSIGTGRKVLTAQDAALYLEEAPLCAGAFGKPFRLQAVKTYA